MDLSIILPTLNEENNIGPLILDLSSTLSGWMNFEIIVVDDLSSDNTVHEVTIISERDNRVKILQRLHPDGLANAIKFGILEANGKFVCWMDADGSMPAASVLEMWNSRRSDIDIVVASRFINGGGFKGVTENNRNPFKVWVNLKKSNDSFVGMVLSRILNSFLRIILSSKIRDYTSGFILIEKRKLNFANFQGVYGEYCLFFLYQSFRSGMRIIEIPYINLPRKNGVSKTGTTIFQLIRTGIPYVTIAFRARFFTKLLDNS